MNWNQLIKTELSKAYLADTWQFIENRKKTGVDIYPPSEQIFAAFDTTPFEQVKVVILGQDPYHGAGQAHGLAFSVLPDIKIPPSLLNMYKTLKKDIEGFQMPSHGYLLPWAEQGVLLLNTVLTVEAGEAHSHAHLGWEAFTDVVIDALNEKNEKLVFLLWGAHAKKKGNKIDRSRHFVLEAPHPSPLSAHRGFFECQHFSKTNEFLAKHGKKAIDWQV